ncbi:LysM peptidoglycan-binding domain-containing protein [Paenibacillus popilliae]|uniref:Predicted glycosyl hydrolase n=1 Tax=Paenibacillus popilliae ATCC 14706 TaxID=1212764 RepID=M9M2I8_PAEPP|nr:LysM peptidoglycan-binding domain-containing protein [Paenibacillus popilliae]GAC41368.1 predicted glycosyl hydrolase [Paenibacillus popilliae ATCC 14706]
MKIHIVKNGESLYSISQKYDVPLEKLLKMNPQLQDPNKIDVGMKIKVPSSSHPQTGHEIVHKHVVKEGDTLWKLSKAWGVPLQEMIEANPQLKNPNVLVVGQVVNIPKVSGMMPPSSETMPINNNKGEMTAPKPKAEITPPEAELTKPKPEMTKPKVEITLPKYEFEFEMEKVEYDKPEKPNHEYPICPSAPTLPIPAPPVLECPEPPAILPYMEEKAMPFYSCPETYAPVKDISNGWGEPHYHHPFSQYLVPAAEVVAPSGGGPTYVGDPSWEMSPVMQPPHGCGGGYPLIPYSHTLAQPVFVSPAAPGDPTPTEWPPSMPEHHGMGKHGKWHPHHGMGEHGKWHPHHGMSGHGEWHPHHEMGEHGKWHPNHGMSGHGEWHSHSSHVYPGMHQTFPAHVSPEAGWHNREPYWGMPQHHWKKEGWEKGKSCECGGHQYEEKPEAETATASSAETNGEPEERTENTSDKEKKATIRSVSGKKSLRSGEKAKASNRKQRSQGIPWING